MAITLKFPPNVSMPAIGGIVEIEDVPFGESEVLIKDKSWRALEEGGFEATYTAEELEFCLKLADRIYGESVQTDELEDDIVERALEKFGAKQELRGEAF